MAYQSFFKGANASPTASTSSGGGYKSFFGVATAKAPSQKDLAAQRAQKQQVAKQQVAKQPKQEKQQQPKKNQSLISKTVNFVKNDVIKPVVQTTEKATNTVGAGIAAGAGLTKITAQAVTGNKKGAKETAVNTQKVINEKLTKGAGGVGGYLTPEQAAARGGGTKGLVKNFVKPSAQAVTDIAPLVIPVGKTAEGATLLRKAVTGAVENGGVSGLTTAANEAINGRFTKKESAKETAKGVITGAALGAVVPFIHAGAGKLSTKEASQTLNRAKQDTLLSTARKSNEADITAATPQVTPNTEVDLLANVRPREATNAPALPTDTHVTPQNTLSTNVSTPEKPIINSVPATVAADIEAHHPVVAPESAVTPEVQQQLISTSKPAKSVSEKPAAIKPDNIVTTGNELDGNLQQHELSGSALEEYKAAKDYHDKTVASYKASEKAQGKEFTDKRIKALGYQFAAEKRRITGNLTSVERRAIVDKERSAYVGKKVDIDVNGKTVHGEIAGTPSFGNVKVKLEDGSTVSVKHYDLPDDKRSDAEILAPHVNKSEAKKYTAPADEPKMTSIKEALDEKRIKLEDSKKPIEIKTTEPSNDIKTTPKAIEQKDSKFKSRVYERLQKEQPESLKDEVGYKRVNLKEDAAKAVDIVATDKNQAYRIALGIEDHPDVTSTAVNIAMSEKALEDNNATLYSQLVKARSLMQTRRGQEIVAEKGSVTDNSTARYVKELLQSRLNKLGKDYFSNLNYGEKLKKNVTPAQRGIAEVDRQVAKAQKEVRKTSNLKVKAAQDIIDSLAC